jgi:hypothetical protein
VAFSSEHCLGKRAAETGGSLPGENFDFPALFVGKGLEDRCPLPAAI